MPLLNCRWPGHSLSPCLETQPSSCPYYLGLYSPKDQIGQSTLHLKLPWSSCVLFVILQPSNMTCLCLLGFLSSSLYLKVTVYYLLFKSFTSTVSVFLFYFYFFWLFVCLFFFKQPKLGHFNESIKQLRVQHLLDISLRESETSIEGRLGARLSTEPIGNGV